MVENKTLGTKIFQIINTMLLIFLALLCLLPVMNTLAISLSSSTAVNAGKVYFWPVDFTLDSYKFVIMDKQYFRSLRTSVFRVILGVSVNMVLMVITAYPLSKSSAKLHGRNIYMTFFVITMFISGGMIPTYLLVAGLGLLDSIWALILPGALQVYNMVIMMNFMRGLPQEIEEAAFIDGANPLQALIHVMLPLLKPSLATLALFSLVGHWNEWFSGMIYMRSATKYPLQTYLQSLINNVDAMIRQNAGGRYMELLAKLNGRTGRAAQIFVATLPIMLIYPLLQKYFTKGLILGSVKG